MNPDNDAERDTTTEFGEATPVHNPQYDRRPVDPEDTLKNGWGKPYGENVNCHGVVPFKNIVPEVSERARIAALHDKAQAGLDQFGLTVPFRGALAYQCVEFGEPIEIRVTDSFVPAAPIIGTATVNDGGTSVHIGPGRAFATARACSFLPSGRTVMVYAVVDGGVAGQVEGSDTSEWYRIAIYSGEAAYVFKGYCSELT